MEAFADVARAGKALYIGVSEWTPEQLRSGARWLGNEISFPLQPVEVQRPLPRHRTGGRAAPARMGIGQFCFSPIEQDILTGKY